jgi:hypothetical protein
MKTKYTKATDEQVKWGSNDDPRGLLEPGKEYEIEGIEMHSWHSKIHLKEFPGKKFNSSSFEIPDSVYDEVREAYLRNHGYGRNKVYPFIFRFK